MEIVKSTSKYIDLFPQSQRELSFRTSAQLALELAFKTKWLKLMKSNECELRNLVT